MRELVVISPDGDGWRAELVSYEVTEHGGLRAVCTGDREFHLSPQTNWQIHKFEEGLE